MDEADKLIKSMGDTIVDFTMDALREGIMVLRIMENEYIKECVLKQIDVLRHYVSNDCNIDGEKLSEIIDFESD